MRCAECKVPLISSMREGVSIEYCPECHGIWLERGALDKIVERSLDVFYEGDRYPSIQQEGSRMAYMDRTRPLHLGVYDTTA